jgi:hypothetical protein
MDTLKGIRTNLTSWLEDLDYADDLCLLSLTLSDMKHKFRRLEDEAKRVGLKTNIAKTKEMRIMSANSDSVYLNFKLIERSVTSLILEVLLMKLVVMKLT